VLNTHKKRKRKKFYTSKEELDLYNLNVVPLPPPPKKKKESQCHPLRGKKKFKNRFIVTIFSGKHSHLPPSHLSGNAFIRPFFSSLTYSSNDYTAAKNGENYTGMWKG